VLFDARAAANLAFGLAAAGRLPARLHSSLAAIVAGGGGGKQGPATAAELGQIHVAGVALRARGAMAAAPKAAAAGKTPAHPPPLDFDSFMRSLFDAGRAERAAAACWGAGAPLGAARVTRSQRELVAAVSALLPAAAARELVPEHRAAGLAAVDAALPASKVAIEFDGPSHFFANAPASPVGGTRFKRALLRSQGWTVVSVPSSHWAQLGSDEQRTAYAAVALGRHAAAGEALCPAAVAAARAALGGGGGRGGRGAAGAGAGRAPAAAARPKPSSSSSSKRLADALWGSFEAMREEYERVQGDDNGGGDGMSERGNAGGEAEDGEEKELPPPPAAAAAAAPPPPPSPPPPAIAATAEQMAKRLAALRIRQGRLGGGGSAASAALAIRKAAAVAAASAAAAAAEKRKRDGEEGPPMSTNTTTNPE